MLFNFERCLKPVFLFTALIAAALPAPCLASEPALALREAQRLAIERSRTLAGQRLSVSASRDMAVAAGQYPDPVVTLGIDNVPAEGNDKFSLTRDFMTMKRVAVMQELTGGEKRRLRAERYELEAQKGVIEQQATLALIQRDVALAWLEAWHAEAMAGVLAEQRVRGLQEVQAAEAEYRAGRGSQSDVLVAHSGLAMLDDRAADLERRVRTTRTMLARWTGEEARRALGPRPDIGSIDMAMHDGMFALHPQIQVLARAQEIAVSEARLARANKKPDWSVEFAYSERASRFGDMFSVGVSIPFPWDQVNRQDREASAKLALAGQAEALREEALRQHEAEVRSMVQEWESNRTRLARYEREIIPLASRRAEATVAAYRGGKSSQGEVLAARRSELEARLQALQLESETARLWAQLNYLMPESLK
ncbi:MAG: TolC family protein [Pseudomonadota bacterium]|nr:TolC family protein [Pseudomonadota bacterium]